MADSGKSNEAPLPSVSGDGAYIEDEQLDAKKHDSLDTTLPTLQSPLQRLTDKALDFLAHASNESLGACFVGLGATTYFILGRIGLVAIGVAGGVVLHATWDGIRGDTRDEATKRADQERKNAAGVEVARRALDWRTLRRQDDEVQHDDVTARQVPNFSHFEPLTRQALDAFVDAAIKDYVDYWYGPTLPGEQSFPTACRETLVGFILSLSGHLQRKRPADAMLDFVTNSCSILLVFLNELSSAVHASPSAAPHEAISTYLELKPESSLAYMIDEVSQQKRLSTAAEDILQAYLDQKVYDCRPAQVFLNQILAQLVLGSTVALCSKPEWLNEWIVYGLEESQTTQEVMDIVDAGVQGRDPATEGVATSSKSIDPNPAPPENISSRKEAGSESGSTSHRERQMSRAQEAMDEAMQEAKRLTQMMVEADENRTTEGAVQSVTAVRAEQPAQGDSLPTTQASRSEEDTELKPQPFTNFDQILPRAQPAVLTDSPTSLTPSKELPVLTLHQAKISVFDDGKPNDQAILKSKPTLDYLIQIEPNSSAFGGWMIVRQYADFETLHEVLRRISVITGVYDFTSAYSTLPKWNGLTKPQLRQDLEKYLGEAVKYQQLAESEGMKRFLEKDQGLGQKSPSGNKGLSWPTPEAFGKIGGDMMNVLTKAPKQVAGGVAGSGKAVFGGMAGFMGTAKKTSSNSLTSPSRVATSSRIDGKSTPPYGSKSSLEGAIATEATSNVMSTEMARQDTEIATALHRRSSEFHDEAVKRSVPSIASSRTSLQMQPEIGSIASFEMSKNAPASTPSTAEISVPELKLPPPPSEITADYGGPVTPAAGVNGAVPSSVTSVPANQAGSSADALPNLPPRPKSKSQAPLTDEETAVVVELMFAVVTELFNLSSAWNIRRTLLTAAKTYLLRPGNPQLATIKTLLQGSLLDANISDEGIASHIRKLRENGLPTEAEMEIWRKDYPEKNEEQKDELRIKARHLLVTKGMPQALSSVMGAAASGEALGKVFDCLQVPAVSRGLVFGLMLQALKVVTH